TVCGIRILKRCCECGNNDFWPDGERAKRRGSALIHRRILKRENEVRHYSVLVAVQLLTYAEEVDCVIAVWMGSVLRRGKQGRKTVGSHLMQSGECHVGGCRVRIIGGYLCKLLDRWSCGRPEDRDRFDGLVSALPLAVFPERPEPDCVLQSIIAAS